MYLEYSEQGAKDPSGSFAHYLHAALVQSIGVVGFLSIMLNSNIT